MKYLLDAIVVLVLYLIQAVFAGYFQIFGFKPDLLFLYLCYRSFQKGSVYGSVLGFLIGLLQDIYSPVTLGASSLVKTVSGILLGRAGKAIYKQDVPFHLFVIFIALLAHDLVFNLITNPGGLVHNFIYVSFGTGVYTVAIGAAISLITYMLNKVIPG